MKEVFTIGRSTSNGFVPVTDEPHMSFYSFRIACDYKDEFYSGPKYAVMSRHVTEWTVVV